MKTILNIAILGAGAMGAVFTAHFMDAPGFTTSLIAEGERLVRLQQKGLIINGKSYHVPVVEPQKVEQPADLIIVAVKHHHLPRALENLTQLVGDQTVFLSVMNGLESEEMIGAMYGMEKVLYAVSLAVDAVRVENQVTFTRPGIHYFGEANNRIISERVRRVQEAFDRASIQYETPEDMIRKMWWKFMFNVGINQASAVMRAPYGVFQTVRDAQALMEALMFEVLALAQASQVNLVEKDLWDWYPVLNLLSPQGKTSMLQDVEAQRKTEVEVFGGKVIQLGQKLGISTPVNQTVVQILRTLEQNMRD